VVFSFSLAFSNLLVSSLISSMTQWWLSNVLFVYFLMLFLLLRSGFNALWSDRMQGVI
jgi:hypothetical protein